MLAMTLLFACSILGFSGLLFFYRGENHSGGYSWTTQLLDMVCVTNIVLSCLTVIFFVSKDLYMSVEYFRLTRTLQNTEENLNREWMIQNTSGLAKPSLFRRLFGSLLAVGTSQDFPNNSSGLEPESCSFNQGVIEMISNPMQMMPGDAGMNVKGLNGTKASLAKSRSRVLKGRNPIDMVDNPIIASEKHVLSFSEKRYNSDLAITQPSMHVDI